MSKRNKLLSKAEYAARIGVHRSQVTRYVKAGMPSPGGMIDPEEADWWREQNLDPTKPKSKVTPPQQRKAAIEKEASAIEAATPPPRAPKPQPQAPGTEVAGDEDGGGPEGVPNLNEARAWDTHFSAENRKRKMLAHDRAHISMAEVSAAWDAATMMFRQGLEGVAGRLAGVLAAKIGGDAAVIEEMLRDEHRRVLASVADCFEKAAVLAEDGDPVPEGGDDAEAAEEAVD